MTKNELAAAIAEETGLTRKDSAAALGAAMQIIQAALVRGEKVTLVGFGVFEIGSYPKLGNGHPWTGRKPVFRPSAPLRQAVNV